MKTIEELKKQGYKLSNFYKVQDSDKVYWIASDHIGEHMFSFDKKIIYNLFADYPNNLTEEQVEIFDKENPYWANFLVAKSDNMVDKKYSIHPIITLGRVDIQYL